MAFNPAEPSASIYGIFPQLYGQSLAQSTGDPTADAINRLTLGRLARGSASTAGYEDLIRQANQMGASVEMAGQQKDRDVAWLNNIDKIIKVAGGRGVMPGQSTGLQIDPRVVAQADAAQAQAQQAENLQRVGTGMDAAAGADFAFDPSMIAGMLTNPWSSVIAPAPTKHVTTENQADMIRANNDTIKANASMISAKKPSGGDGDNKTSTEENQVWDPKTKTWKTISRTVKSKGGSRDSSARKSDTVADDDSTKTEVRQRKYIQDANGNYVKNPNYKGK